MQGEREQTIILCTHNSIVNVVTDTRGSALAEMVM